MRLFHLRLTHTTLITYPFPVDIGLTVRSGQLLSWDHLKSDDEYLLFHRRSLLRVKRVSPADVELEVKGDPLREEEIETIMGVRTQRNFLPDPARTDPFLASLFLCYRGLVLLRQDPYECLISFMASGMSTIARTRGNLAVLRRELGDVIPGTAYRTLPSAEVITALRDPEKGLRKMGFGYRAVPIAETCRLVCQEGMDPGEWGILEDDELRARLMALPGVGQKIAECVLLFGFGRMGAFPVDVWVMRALESRWPSESKRSAEQWNKWGREKWGQRAGFVQQMLFVWARENP